MAVSVNGEFQGLPVAAASQTPPGGSGPGGSPPARFVVTEVEGYRIGGSWIKLGVNQPPLLSCSVIDTALNFAEVARFNEEDTMHRLGTPSEVRRESIRNRAAGLCWMLNEDEREGLL